MAEARSDVAGLVERGAALASLLKQKKFPAIPREWVASEDVVTWHSKVARTFDELKVANPDTFKTICTRLPELEVSCLLALLRLSSDLAICRMNIIRSPQSEVVISSKRLKHCWWYRW
jgi:hypothetical protein